MTDSTFQVVFDGQLVEGADPDRVKAAIAKMFNTDVARVEPLFSGRRAVIKRDLDEATARKYRAGFERAGAVVHILDASGAVLDPGVAGRVQRRRPPHQRPPRQHPLRQRPPRRPRRRMPARPVPAAPRSRRPAARRRRSSRAASRRRRRT